MLRNKRIRDYSMMNYTQRQILIDGFDEIWKCSDGEKYCLENYRPMKIGKSREINIEDSFEKRRIFWERAEKFKESEAENKRQGIDEFMDDSLAILRGEK